MSSKMVFSPFTITIPSISTTHVSLSANHIIMAPSETPIAGLGADLLSEVFDLLAQHGNASLISAALCCKKWQPLALGALYKDVVLNERSLPKFVENCADTEVNSFTVSLPMVACNPYDTSVAIEGARERIAILRQLCPLIKRMNPVSVSMSVSMPFPCTASCEIASIIASLPTLCTSLELDMRYDGNVWVWPLPDISTIPRSDCHLCDSIRSVLPRLRHLRLRLPTLCAALFSDPSSTHGPGHAVSAPNLKTCLISLSMGIPSGVCGRVPGTTSCSGDYTKVPHTGNRDVLPSALPPIVEVLNDFACLNSNSLERLWIIDLPRPNLVADHCHTGCVRRDFIAKNSVPIPIWLISAFPRNDVARVPSPTNLEKTVDWVGELEKLKIVVEGQTWVETSLGARLPATLLRGRVSASLPQTRTQYQETHNRSTEVWQQEERTGQSIMAKGPGELMHDWVLDETPPPGWKRHEDTNAMTPVST